MTDEQIIEFWKDKQAIDIELLINHLPKFIEIIQKQQEELEKKDKVIDLILEEMVNNHCSIRDIVAEEICDDRCIGNNNWTCFKHIKEYFYKKVEGK